MTFTATNPCVGAAVSGNTTLYTVASGGGTFDFSPLTTLLTSYVAGQLGTDIPGLLANPSSNANYQTFANSRGPINAAEQAVIFYVNATYHATVPVGIDFLTVAFVAGSGTGTDAVLDNLPTALSDPGTGMPPAAAVSALNAQGKKSPFLADSGGTGGTGAAGAPNGASGTGVAQ